MTGTNIKLPPGYRVVQDGLGQIIVQRKKWGRWWDERVAASLQDAVAGLQWKQRLAESRKEEAKLRKKRIVIAS